MYSSEFSHPNAPPPNYSEQQYVDQPVHPGFAQSKVKTMTSQIFKRTMYPIGTPVVTQPTQTIIFAGNNFGPYPSKGMCPRCNCEVITQTRPVIGGATWLIAGVLCFVGCIPCCLIPFFVESCQDCEHTCFIDLK
ncbi:lipopolysaccharide-induced tumor necrosis factor-alpha factor-like protein [Leptotrombidium deliense]|uniref:Lipopolysaccharide-induced tumor necrosis factor-alpha factor-like protein n=1 Tax=Leptotrombidium deliense TaxID=299467 RepID=A0A443RWY9_9ACAR|nr:lipopolysaccharide-induced tumor necrosis factor-alpha factor-like protein [Leptotrombidium deliense]